MGNNKRWRIMGTAISWVLPIKKEKLLVWKICYEETVTENSAAKQLDTKFPPESWQKCRYLQSSNSATTNHQGTDMSLVVLLGSSKVSSRPFYTWSYQCSVMRGSVHAQTPWRPKEKALQCLGISFSDNSWISSVHIKHDRRKPLLRSLGLDMFPTFPSLSEENNSTSTTSGLKIGCLLCRVIDRITWASHSFSTHVL